jgi:hypothetical protein
LATKNIKKRRGSVGWALGLSWLSTLLLTALAIFLMLLTTVCSESFMRKQVARSSFADYAYSYLYDNFVSYGSSTGFEADVITSTISRDQIKADMEQAVTDLYAGNTAVNARENVKAEINDVLLADLNSRGKEVTDDVSSAVEIVADACRLDYANYVAVPLASQLYTLIAKMDRLVVPGVIVAALLCAVALVLMMRLAGSPRLGVRCLTFTFTASALLCALGATVLYPLLGLDNFSLDPASIRALVLTYLRSMLGSLGIFAAVYALVAAILLGFMFVARHQLKRRYQNNT